MKQKFTALTAFCLLLGACVGTTEKPAGPEPDAAAEAQPAPVEEKVRPFPGDSFYDLLVAEFAVRRNRFDLALGNYMQQAHETRDPAVVARATRLAQFLKADNAALDAAQLWTEVEPTNLEGQFTLSTMRAKQGHPLEAMAPMTDVLENGGETNFAAIAASALKLDEPTRLQLEREFDQLLQRYPGNAQLLTGKALLLQQRGETEPALEAIRQVLKTDPQDLHAIVVEARLLQQLDREDEAFARLETVVAAYPHNRRLRLQYARMLMTRDLEAAKAQFELLLEGTPRDPDLLLSLGLISHETGHVDEARIYLQRLLETGERTQEAHYYLGQLEEQQQHWQQALFHYEQITPGKDYVAAVSRITAIYLQLNELQTARDYLGQVREKHPEHALQVYLLEAEVLNRGGDYKASAKLLTEALLLYPDQPNLLYARSMVYEKLGRYGDMEHDLQAIIDREPDNAVALNALGYILINQNRRLDEAYAMIQRALALKPNDPAILDSLGWAEFRRGNLARAQELLERAFKAYPDPEVAAHLGEVLWQQGRQDEAVQAWQRGLQRAPDSKLIHDVLQRLGVDPARVAPPEPAAGAE